MIDREEDDRFETVWGRITVHAGERFATKTGLPFVYKVRGDVVIPDRTDYPLHVSNFRSAFALLPLSGPGAISALVRGPAYMWAILADSRIQPLKGIRP
jgi:hypothetical protein